MSSMVFSDIPQDLSAKFKTVSVQTEDSREHMDVFRDLMAGFSERQVRVLIGVLSQFLWKQNLSFTGINCQEIPESEQLLHRIQNLQELHKGQTGSGWTPLEPETPPISPPLTSLLRSAEAGARLASASRTWSPENRFLTSGPEARIQPPPLVAAAQFRPGTSTQSGDTQQDQVTKSDEERDDGSVSGAMSRDEKLVQEMNIPCSVEEIISKPMEEFNDLLSRHSVSEEVINVCRDIRRRGKNKIAAQNCRKRKVEQIYSLEEELSFARMKKKRILSERAELLRRQQEWRSRIARLERSVLRSVGKSEATWSLHADLASGKVSFIDQSLSENCKPYPSLTVIANKDVI